MASQTAQSLISELETAARTSRLAWPAIGRLLHEAERAGTWRGSAENFTAWMREVAGPACGLKETAIWRYLRAFRVYERLRADLLERGATLPAPEKLQTLISPEGLELLDKLTRVAPPEVTDPMAVRLAAGTLARKELRAVWEDYRPALLGRTAQGRGVPVPKVDARNPQAEAALMRGRLLSLLRRGAPAWAGAGAPDVYAVFANVQVPADAFTKGSGREAVDAVVLIRRSASARPELYGLCVCPDGPEDSGLAALAAYFTQVWLVLAPGKSQRFDPSPKHRIGVLRLTGEELVVLAIPRPRPGDGAKVGELALELLIAAVQART
jgi:hypothetical protein